jgi:hypothetical protein
MNFDAILIAALVVVVPLYVFIISRMIGAGLLSGRMSYLRYLHRQKENDSGKNQE